MIKNRFKINTNVIASLPSKLINKFDLETCYSGAYSKSQKKIVFPSTSTGEIFIYLLSSELKVKETIKVDLPRQYKPDIAIFRDDQIIVGCRDSAPPIAINNEYKVNELFSPDIVFYATCFKCTGFYERRVKFIYPRCYFFIASTSNF